MRDENYYIFVMTEETEELLKQYPFIQAYDMSGEPVKEYTVIGGMPDGWRKAFVKPMLEDFKNAAIEDGIDYTNQLELSVIDVKEKYGSLRWYWAAKKNSPHLDRVTMLYEEVASAFCCKCGKHPVMMTTGYILPLCEDCWKEHELTSIADDGRPFKPEFPKVTSTRYEDGKKVEEVLPLKELFDRIVNG